MSFTKVPTPQISHAIPSRSPSASALFVEDGKGDRRNLEYGSLDRHTVPRYQAIGRGYVLGLQPEFRIVSRSEARLVVENVDVDSTRRTRRDNLLSSIANEPITRVHGGLVERDTEADYLEFEHGRKRRRTMRDSSEDTDSDSAKASDTYATELASLNAFDVFKADPRHIQHLELQKATEERAHDLSAWLALINYQDVLFHDTVSLPKLADLKIPLYERALSHIKNPDSRHTLIAGLMREAGLVWEVNTLMKKWQTILIDHSAPKLQKLYVDFLQTTPGTFDFGACLKAYFSWLQNLQSLPKDLTAKDQGPSYDRLRDSEKVYALLRVTLFLWQSGYTERAVGTWQALLEWNCNNTNPQGDIEARKRDLESFWAREAPRFGESGSMGWDSSRGQVHDIPNPVFELEADEIGVSPKHSASNSTTFLERWGAAEISLGKTTGLPTPLDDNDLQQAKNSDDPHCAVLFDDFRAILFVIATEEGRLLLIDAFLLFVGLPPVSSLQESRMWTSDPFTSPLVPTALKSLQINNEPYRGSGMFARFENVVLTVQQLRGEDLKYLLLVPDRLLYSHTPFVRRAVAQLADLSMQRRLPHLMMEYAVAFEAGLDLKSGRKTAIKYLKRTGDDLKLLDLVANLDLEIHGFNKAEVIWSAALLPRAKSDMGVRAEAHSLWRNWAYAYMRRGRFDLARTLLNTLADLPLEALNTAWLEQATVANRNPSAAGELLFSRHIRSQIEILVSEKEILSLCAIMDVLAFRVYLQDGQHIRTGLEIYNAHIAQFKGMLTTEFAMLEAIHEQRARFMYAHVGTFRREFKPKEILDLLKTSVQTYSENLVLLKIHHYFKQKAGMIDRLRQSGSNEQQQSGSSQEASVIPSMFDVMVELNRPTYSGSTIHSTRSTFQRVTAEVVPGHHSLELWKAFIKWEISLMDRKDGATANGHARRVVEVFHAALRACPWSKGLHMLAFTEPSLSQGLGQEKLMQICEIMDDRGLRLRSRLVDR